MFRWLDGPGKQLKYARPGTTNYLGAYDKQGRFVRGLRAGRSDNDDAENDGDEEGNGRKGNDGEDNGKKVKSNLPPETQEDLRPFPLNPFFRSEPVLSEELRQEIYKRVVERGQSVREVSIALQVEMARVGAVVRLMTIEQEWIRKVSHFQCYFSASTILFSMMRHNKNSISLQDTNMVTNLLYFPDTQTPPTSVTITPPPKPTITNNPPTIGPRTRPPLPSRRPLHGAHNPVQPVLNPHSPPRIHQRSPRPPSHASSNLPSDLRIPTLHPRRRRTSLLLGPPPRR